MPLFRNQFSGYIALSSLAGLAIASPSIASPSFSLVAPPAASTLIAQQPNCTNPQTQADMTFCAGLDYQNADRTLNRRYKTLLPKLGTARRQQLSKAQLKWMTFRDADCTFSGSEAEGGTMQPMLVAGCKAQMTQQRTVDFEAYIAGRTPQSGSNYKAADRQLNELYQKLRQDLDTNRKPKLETAEFAWIAFRDSACGFEASSGGSAARNQCLTRVTTQRNQQLQQYLEAAMR